jgi:excisionase family DNA binding protein
MSTLPSNTLENFTPTIADAALAKESGPRLEQLLAATRDQNLPIQLGGPGTADEPLVLPHASVELLSGILREMAKGNAVTLIPVDAELTTQQAAELLNVSRPFLIEQLDNGSIPHRQAGAQRRVLFKDLMEYKQKMDQKRRRALDELTALSQDLDLGY